MKAYPWLIFETSAWCNAKCYYCPTGKRNLDGNPVPKQFLSPELFRRALEYMLSQGIIDKNTVIDLFNKGEPFLHQELPPIIEILNEYGLPFAFSTNASIPTHFTGDNFLKNCARIFFSMPGLTEEDYKRVHGFSLDKIKKNIATILQNFRQCGFVGDAIISFHLYKHNTHQLKELEEFSNELGCLPNEYPAYIVDYEMLKKFLDKKLSEEELQRIQHDLFLHDAEQQESFWKSAPKNYWCEQENILTLDEQANVAVCCNLPPWLINYSFGSIFDYTHENLQKLKKNNAYCTECRRYGIDYYFAVMNKYRAQDINRLYGKQLINYIPYAHSPMRKLERIAVRLYLFAIRNWGYCGYYMDKILDLKKVYRFLVRKKS